MRLTGGARSPARHVHTFREPERGQLLERTGQKTALLSEVWHMPTILERIHGVEAASRRSLRETAEGIHRALLNEVERSKRQIAEVEGG